MTENRSLLVRGWLGFWRVLNGARIVFLNVLFLLFLYVFYIAMLRPDEPMTMRGDTTLVLRPHGNVVEQYSTSPLDRALARATDQAPVETRLRDILAAIDRASRDSRISQMVIDTDYLWNVGLSSLQDIEHAINSFKASGKPVFAVAEALGQHQYYLASLADEIWLSPDGIIWIDGYSNIRHFYREGLEKLEVEINLFRAGEYKSAMEPYIRNDMSPEAKEAAQFWLESIWQQYLDAVSRNRGIPLSRLTDAINNFADRVEASDGNFSQLALELGLVDRLVSGPEARTILAATGAPNDAGDSFRAVGIDHYLEISGHNSSRQRGNVRIVVAEGEITRGEQPAGRIGAQTTAGDLRAAGRDEQVKAVVLRIDSPGGDAFSSEVIRREVQALRDAGKTVVVSMGDVAASGGYWIAMGANEIWASPATITGSIGVFGMIPTFGAPLANIGVHTDGVGTTPLAGKLRIDRPLDEDIKRIFQSSTDHVYEQFLELVRKSRDFESRDAVNEVARGRVWSGTQAAERGLVDRTGTLQDAIESAARIAGLADTYTVSWTEPELTQFERLLLEMTSGVMARIDHGQSGVDAFRRSFVQNLLEDLQFISSRDGSFNVAAHCLCGIQ